MLLSSCTAPAPHTSIVSAGPPLVNLQPSSSGRLRWRHANACRHNTLCGTWLWGSLAVRHHRFDPKADLLFDYGPALPGHANGMVLMALGADGKTLLEETYYSIGGGFVLTAGELAQAGGTKAKGRADVPFPFESAEEMLAMAKSSGLSIAAMKRANECAHQSDDELNANLDRIWAAMRDCMNRGLHLTGTLPGGLKVKRRAAEIYRRLQEEKGNNAIQPHQLMDWLSVYAMAVNEENAAGGRVVTAPTNGAAGVIPATIRYYLDHCLGADQNGIRTFLLAAAAIGGLIKHNASISGAEVGCQGEVGSASAMASAGLCAARGQPDLEAAFISYLEEATGGEKEPVAPQGDFLRAQFKISNALI